MALSYNLGYQESISVHPTRRQIFAGKPDSTFPNIWELLIYPECQYFSIAESTISLLHIGLGACLWHKRCASIPSLGSSRQSSAGRSGIYCVSGAFKLNIDLTDNTEKIQRLYLALEAVIDDHREYGSAGEGSLWSRLAVYVEAVLKNLFIELSMQVKRSDWSSHILDEAKFYKLS